MNPTFFRQEVKASLKQKHLGTVLMNIPIPYAVLSMGCIAVVVMIVLFVLFAEFSEQMIVTGYLNAREGIARLYPRQNGVILTCYVQQGAVVKQGDPLFLIDTSYDGLAKRHQHDLYQQLQTRMQAVENRIHYKTNYLIRLKPLLLKKYIALSTYHAQQDEIAALENQKSDLNAQLIKYRESRSYVIRAPVNGTVSSLMYQEGQYTNLSKPLVSILPQQSNLIAELYVPVMKSGFLKQGAAIVLRYDAYPYQHFGTALGTITGISQTILTDADEDKPIRVGQPYYKVTATLNKQFIQIQGRPHTLRHGMTCTAVILGSKKKLWQWMLGPVYHYAGAARL